MSRARDVGWGRAIRQIWRILGQLPYPWPVWPSCRLKNTPANRQADQPDHDHNNVEVASRRLVGGGADAQTDHCQRDDRPIRPAQEREEGNGGEDEGDKADQQRDEVAYERNVRSRLRECKGNRLDADRAYCIM